MKAILTQKVTRPNTQLERKISFVEWMAKVQSNFYADFNRIDSALESID